eukprot:892473-Karenia_brevis.AAC.1
MPGTPPGTNKDHMESTWTVYGLMWNPSGIDVECVIWDATANARASANASAGANAIAGANA